MSEEELKAIEFIEKDILEWFNKGKDYIIVDIGNEYKLMTILNLIEKQQKEIEKLEKNRKVSQYFAKTVAEEYIHKDKIREILNKYSKKEIEYAFDFYREIEELLEE